MSGANLVTEAILLSRQESGEKGLLLGFLSPTHGLLKAFKRTSSSRQGSQPIPDLFDEVAVILEHGRSGDLWFVREYNVRRRRSGIGGNYGSLLYASRFAQLLGHHLFAAEEAAEWHRLFEQSLDAWETQVRPEAAYFKCLYLFSRQQGIPVK
jgi:recombinational DNA repair protein (RecF pathway)